MQKIALRLALAALGVNAPRFVILFLLVDGLYLARGMEGLLLAVSGIATATVLSGGGAFIAHVLAQPTRGGSIRSFLLLSWVMLLVFNVILLAPMLVMTLRRSELVVVLNSPDLQWLWCITAIVSVEWLAGGAMAAHALLDANRPSEDPLSYLRNLWSGWQDTLAGNGDRVTPPEPTPQRRARRQPTE
jgi:hypothetical protein